MKALLKLDKTLPKVIDRTFNKAMRIMVGNQGAGGATRSQQLILNKFRKRWAGNQTTFEPLTQETENRKLDRDEEFMLVSDGALMRSVRDTIRTKTSGKKLIATVTVPTYGKYLQEGTANMPPRVFFGLGTKGEEKFFFDLMDSIFVVELNKLGLRAKEK
jgi:hypothetical protein